MSQEFDADSTLTVTEGDVTVEKSYAEDEFPVPAIRFRLVSAAEETTTVQLVDEIPEAFPMESVGFHPDYESDNWTAYKDHRVEFSRALDPGEEVITVYGVRLDDDDDPADFLHPPSLDDRAVGDDVGPDGIDDILGHDDNVVREVLSGERDSLPGLDSADADDPAIPLDAAAPAVAETDDSLDESGPVDADAETPVDAAAPDPLDAPETSDATDPTPRSVDDDLRHAVTRHDAAETAEADESAAPLDDSGAESDDGPTTDDEPDAGVPSTGAKGPDIPADPLADESTPATDTEDGETPVTADADDETRDAAPETPDAADADDDAAALDAPASLTAAPGSVVAALAAEIESGEVREEDVDRLREALAPGLPRSTDLRISKLQSKVEDLSAYSDALAEFIDDNGTGSELIEALDAELDDVQSELDALHGRLSGVEDEQGEVRDAVDAASDRVEEAVDRADAVDDKVAAVEGRVASNADRIGTVAADAADAEERVDSLDTELGDVREDIASLDADVVSLGEDVDARVETVERDVSRVRGDVADVKESVAELEAFRDRLGSALGGVGGEDAE